MSRWDYLRLFVRRWPVLWEQRTATPASWWMRLASGPMAVLMLMRKPGRFPVVQELEFSLAGVSISMGERSRQHPWSDFCGRMELGDIWVLGAPGFDLPVFLARLTPSAAEALRTLLRERVALAPTGQSLIGR